MNKELEVEHVRLRLQVSVLAREHDALEQLPVDIAAHREHRARLASLIVALREHQKRLKISGGGGR